MRPITQLLVVMLIGSAAHLVTIAALDDARTERDALHIDLVNSTLKRRALAEQLDHRQIRHLASTDLLRACRDKLVLRDAKHDHQIIGLAIRQAEHYGVSTAEVAEVGQ